MVRQRQGTHGFLAVTINLLPISRIRSYGPALDRYEELDYLHENIILHARNDSNLNGIILVIKS
jgi:hypothetical protein